VPSGEDRGYRFGGEMTATTFRPKIVRTNKRVQLGHVSHHPHEVATDEGE